MKIATFLQKATTISGKMSPSQFLVKHRDYICGFPRLTLVMAQYEQGKLFPFPALEMICTIIALEKDPFEKTEETVNKTTGEIEVRSPVQVQKIAEKKISNAKKYCIFVHVKNDFGGVEVQDEVFYAELFQEAWRLSYRKLFHNVNAVRCEIIGLGQSSFIERGEAVADLLKRGLPPVCKKQKKTTDALGFRVGAKNFVAKFSGG